MQYEMESNKVSLLMFGLYSFKDSLMLDVSDVLEYERKEIQDETH
jgi:hypothetical protein